MKREVDIRIICVSIESRNSDVIFSILDDFVLEMLVGIHGLL